MTTTTNRQPAGTPVGGQFAESAKAAPDTAVQLASALPPVGSDDALPWLYDGDDVDTLAERDGWSPSDYERYYDGVEERKDAELAELQGRVAGPKALDGAEVDIDRSEIDGVLIVQIDTAGVGAGEQIRVFLNDGTIFDGDPDVDETADQRGAISATAAQKAAEAYAAAMVNAARIDAGLVPGAPVGEATRLAAQAVRDTAEAALAEALGMKPAS